MKIAILGGTFNPVHVGHAMLADTIIKELGFDKILFVPANIPPHKLMNSVLDPQIRLKLLEVFCKNEGDGKFEVEPCEIQRQGISYTYETLEFLTEKYKGKLDGKLAFIMGDEVAAEFHKWKNPSRIVELADLIITTRYPDVKTSGDKNKENVPTGSYSGDFKEKFEIEKFEFPCTYLKEPVLPVSSTDIRQRISEGRSVKYLLPPSVYDYIVENNLYIS